MGRYKDRIDARFARQEAKGISKYGHILEQNPRKVIEAIEYGLEEITDLMMYLEEAKEKIERMEAFIKEFDGQINRYLWTVNGLKRIWNEALAELEGGKADV